jgi:hypothetical protein
MIDIRLAVDRRLPPPPPSRHWLDWQLHRSPEGVILDAFEQYRWLCESGLSADEAWETVAPAPKLSLHTGAPDNTRYRHLARLLAQVDPAYVQLVDHLMTEICALADDWSRRKVRRKKAQPSYPQRSWLDGVMSVSDIEAGSPGITALRDWVRIKRWLRSGDELWAFSSLPDPRSELGETRGFALVRNGAPILHVTTQKDEAPKPAELRGASPPESASAAREAFGMRG